MTHFYARFAPLSAGSFEAAGLNRQTLFSLLLVCLMLWPVAAQAQKGNKTPPPPPPQLSGLIFHYRNGEVWAMRPDGSNLVKVLPEVSGFLDFNATPCFRPQGSNIYHDRWYLALAQTGVYDRAISTSGSVVTNVPQRDLFAIRTVPGDPTRIESVQLTDLYGIAYVSNGNFWSNDDNDSPATSFIQTRVYDVRSSFQRDAEGKTSFDVTGQRVMNLRIPITASQITAGWLAGILATFPSQPEDLDLTMWPYLGDVYFDDPPLTPNNQYLAGLQTGQLMLHDPATGSPLRVVWDSTMGDPTSIRGMWQNASAALSPDSTRVAVLNNGRDAKGGVWVLNLEGTASPKQLAKNSSKGSNYTEFDQVFWSSDSQYVLARRKVYQGKLWFDTLILPAAGGAPVYTFSPSPVGGIRWVAAD